MTDLSVWLIHRTMKQGYHSTLAARQTYESATDYVREYMSHRTKHKWEICTRRAGVGPLAWRQLGEDCEELELEYIDVPV